MDKLIDVIIFFLFSMTLIGVIVFDLTCGFEP